VAKRSLHARYVTSRSTTSHALHYLLKILEKMEQLDAEARAGGEVEE